MQGDEVVLQKAHEQNQVDAICKLQRDAGGEVSGLRGEVGNILRSLPKKENVLKQEIHALFRHKPAIR